MDLLAHIKYSPNGKYDNKYFLLCLIDFFKICVNWKKYKGFEGYSINGSYLNQKHNEFIDKGVYTEIFNQSGNIYLTKNKENKIKYQVVDTYFVANKKGSVKNNNYLLTDKTKKKNKKIRKNNKKLHPNKRKKEYHLLISIDTMEGKNILK